MTNDKAPQPAQAGKTAAATHSGLSLTPHPIADIICAWANGFRVEFRYRHHNPGNPEEIYLSDKVWHLCGKGYSAWSGVNEHRIHADDLAAWEASKSPVQHKAAPQSEAQPKGADADAAFVAFVSERTGSLFSPGAQSSTFYRDLFKAGAAWQAAQPFLPAQAVPMQGTPMRAEYVKVARVFALAYGLHDDAPTYLPRTPDESDTFEPHAWVIGAMMQAFGEGWADGHAAGIAVMKAAPRPESQPVGKMTAQRAKFFLERFKHEEKMLGPNEHAGLDYAIACLEREQYATVQPEAQPTLSDDDIDWPDVEGAAHSCVQEALAFGLGYDVIYRHMLSVMFKTAGACRAAIATKSAQAEQGGK